METQTHSTDRMLRIKNKLTRVSQSETGLQSKPHLISLNAMPKTYARGGNVITSAFKLGGYIKHINKHKFSKIK